MQGPPELEEGIIQLERRKRLLPFGERPERWGRATEDEATRECEALVLARL